MNNKSMFNKLNTYALTFLKFFSSREMFMFILGIAALQGTWYALTFDIHNNMSFDEWHHFNFTAMYAERINPFISDQADKWNFLGEVTRNGNYLFYYLMSFPYRLINFFTDNLNTIASILKLIMVTLFVYGLALYAKLFKLLKLGQGYINAILLFIVAIPHYAALSGAYNYENAIFVVVPLILIIAIKIIKSKKIDITPIVLLFCISILGSLIKFPVLAVLFPVVLFISWFLLRRHGFNEMKQQIIYSVRQKNVKTLVLLCVLFLASLSLFVERPVYNYINYGRPRPMCTQIHAKNECLENYTAKRTIVFTESRGENFRPLTPLQYLTGLWIPSYMNTSSLPQPGFPPYLAMEILFTITILLVPALILYGSRGILSKKTSLLIVVVIMVYLAVLMFQNYNGYIRHGKPIALSVRYILVMIPLIGYLAMLGVKYFRHSKYFNILATSSIIIFAILVSQGGGIMTAATKSNDQQINKGFIYVIDQKIENIFDKIIILENNPFRRI